MALAWATHVRDGCILLEIIHYLEYGRGHADANADADFFGPTMRGELPVKRTGRCELRYTVSLAANLVLVITVYEHVDPVINARGGETRLRDCGWNFIDGVPAPMTCYGDFCLLRHGARQPVDDGRVVLQILRGKMTAVGMTAAAAAGAQVWHCGHSSVAVNPANASGYSVEAQHPTEDMFCNVDMQLAVEQSIEEMVGRAGGGAGPSGTTPPGVETTPRPSDHVSGRKRPSAPARPGLTPPPKKAAPAPKKKAESDDDDFDVDEAAPAARPSARPARAAGTAAKLKFADPSEDDDDYNSD